MRDMAALPLLSAFLLLELLLVGGVENCHPLCRCEVESFGLFDSFSLTKVDCSGVGPGTTPVPIPLDTSHLDLSFNSIGSITDSMLSGPGYTTLVSLDLSNNDISLVSPKAFFKLRYLETLDLSHNALENLPAGCFSGLHLTEVDLSDNNFQEFSLDVFIPRAQDIPISVDISNNFLTKVSRNPQGQQLHIKSLVLAGNQLKVVPDLAGIPLQYLNLDGNPIASVHDGDFAEMMGLVYLSLSSMPDLQVIQPHSFQDLRNLQVLELTNNHHLKSLSLNVFSGLESLQELNLLQSAIKTLPLTILSPMPRIRSITLGQDMHCWKTHKQSQFHRQTGLVAANEILTCDATGILL